MNSRRSFIHRASLFTMGLALPRMSNRPDNQIKIGIIGAENSHTKGFGKLFNIDRKFPAVSVDYVWGETDAFAKAAMKEGQIPNQVRDPEEMLGKIDALIVDHRHGKYHLAAAKPFVEAGIPSFIDKPFCYRLEEGKSFLEMARDKGTPVTSYSSIAHSYDTFDQKKQVEVIPDIKQVVMYGRCDIASKYGGVFFYGPHLVEPMIYLFGLGVHKARITNNGKNSSAQIIYDNGMLVTMIFTTKKYGWHTYIETDDGIQEIKSRLNTRSPGKNDVDMVTMFKTRQEPRSHRSILTGIAVLEALEKSVTSKEWEKIESV